MTHLVQILKKEVETNGLDYLILGTSGIVCLTFLKIFKGERLESFLTLIAFTCFYIIWGILHHAKNETIHVKNVIEYIIISFIALTVLTVLMSL